MDLKTLQLIEQLKNNKGMVEGIMRSSDGQKLLSHLTQQDNGGALQKAAAGDTSELANMIKNLMSSKEGAELIERIHRSVQK